MKNEEFIKVLEESDGVYEVEGDRIVVTSGRYSSSVDLDVKTLPPYVTFRNEGDISLSNLEVFPEGDSDIVFANNGYVHLSKLKILTKYVKFCNTGGVYAASLEVLPEGYTLSNGGVTHLGVETLPENVTFKNGRYVDLLHVKRFPASTKFLNGGAIYLNDLVELPHNYNFDYEGCDTYYNISIPKVEGKIYYQGTDIELKTIDGYKMAITSTREIGDYTVMNARYFGTGKLKNSPKCYVARRGEHYAHGKTMKEAIRDVEFKHLQATANVEELVKEVKEAGSVTLTQYRLLTGACEEGCHHFLDEYDIPRDTESLPLEEVLQLTEDAYGGERMRELFPDVSMTSAREVEYQGKHYVYSDGKLQAEDGKVVEEIDEEELLKRLSSTTAS